MLCSYASPAKISEGLSFGMECPPLLLSGKLKIAMKIPIFLCFFYLNTYIYNLFKYKWIECWIILEPPL